ncbi:Rz1-like lysis system protein LysC [Burkholderia gladioli]|uniref:Rz1-like lysis system protein LysC n=1 Tax=Burkholderia gladioli TaxID=28095 RepID=UPI001CF52178|nr:Rz1-like lysis system protein LysC [Burkholderia gladioli]MCA8167579.1 Rz1-like lysis system protein LysC [Burkholderia gladioli]
MLCACTPVPPSPAPTITLNACATVTRCTLPAMHPRNNGELSDALNQARAAWANCAAEVDMVAACQAGVGASAAASAIAPGVSAHE